MREQKGGNARQKGCGLAHLTGYNVGIAGEKNRNFDNCYTVLNVTGECYKSYAGKLRRFFCIFFIILCCNFCNIVSMEVYEIEGTGVYI